MNIKLGNWISIDPGRISGITVWDHNGVPQIVSQIADNENIVLFAIKAQKIRDHQGIEFAIIEDFYNFGKNFKNAHKVYSQIRVFKEVFEHYILINTSQWNPQNWHTRHKASIAKGIYSLQSMNDHQVDSLLIGDQIYNKARQATGSAYNYLYTLSRTTRQFPRAEELRRKTIEFKTQVEA